MMDADLTKMDDQPKLTGKIEKIFATYGFVVTDDAEKYFFHFGTCATKPEFFKVGDEVEFVLGEDSKTHRIHAQRLAKVRDPGDSTGSLFCSRFGNSAFTAVRSPKSYAVVDKVTNTACQSPISSFNSVCRCPSTNLIAASATPQQNQQQIVTDQYFLTDLTKPNPLRLQAVTGTASDIAVEALRHLQQHSLVSVQCCGLVLSWPKFSEPDCAGTIACEIAGAPTLVKFNASSLKYQLEAPLIFYGVKVNLTAVWHAGLSVWRAKDILPETEVYDGVVCFLSNERLVIKQLGNNKRINVHLSNVSFADDPSFILGQSQLSVGCFVTFAAFFNEKNQPTISRLAVVAPQNVNATILPHETNSQEIGRLDFADVSSDQGTKCVLPVRDGNSLDSTLFNTFPSNQVSACNMAAAPVVPLASDFQASSGQWPPSVSPSSFVQSITPPSAISSSDDTNSSSRSPHCWMINSTTNDNNWVGVFGSYSPTLNAAGAVIGSGYCADAVVGQKSQSEAHLQFN